MHPAALSPPELAKHCQEIRTRRSGPGGQHRNKTETAVVLVHRPTGISAEGSERRSQAENRGMALKRLRLKLALEHREPARAAASATWQRRTRGRQLVIAAGHDDYPALVAEALDRLQGTAWQMAPAAEALGISTTQLVGLFRKAPAAWTRLNAFRSAAGLPPIR